MVPTANDKPIRPRVLDFWWLRWAITLLPFAAAAAVFFKNELIEYYGVGIAAFGTMVCLYFAHVLIFRLQCRLGELWSSLL